MLKDLLDGLIIVAQQIQMVRRLEHHWDGSCVFLSHLLKDVPEGVLVPALDHFGDGSENVVFEV